MPTDFYELDNDNEVQGQIQCEDSPMKDERLEEEAIVNHTPTLQQRNVINLASEKLKRNSSLYRGVLSPSGSIAQSSRNTMATDEAQSNQFTPNGMPIMMESIREDVFSESDEFQQHVSTDDFKTVTSLSKLRE